MFISKKELQKIKYDIRLLEIRTENQKNVMDIHHEFLQAVRGVLSFLGYYMESEYSNVYDLSMNKKIDDDDKGGTLIGAVGKLRIYKKKEN